MDPTELPHRICQVNSSAGKKVAGTTRLLSHFTHLLPCIQAASHRKHLPGRQVANLHRLKSSPPPHSTSLLSHADLATSTHLLKH